MINKTGRVFLILLIFPAFVLAEHPDEDKLNIIFYRFAEESEDIYMELLPGERFRLPPIRGYRVTIDFDKIEVAALTDRDLIEPEGYVLPGGHSTQIFNIGRLIHMQYELLVSFDRQTDRHYISVKNDSIQVETARDEFTKIIIP